MNEQAYFGTCPASDPDGFRLAMLLSHPSDRVRYRPTVTIGCPIEVLTGDGCPDGGTHELRAVTGQQLAELEADSEDLIGGSGGGLVI